MRRLASIFAFTSSAAALVACGARTTALSESDFEPAPLVDSGSFDGGFDSSRGDSAPSDTAFDSRAIDTAFDSRAIDTGARPDVGPTDEHTVGNPCTSDDDCDKTGDGTHHCSSGTFSTGSLYPTPVCIALDCDFGDGTSIMRCDGDKGICLDAGSTGICLAACSFDESGAPPKGCVGRDACNYFTLDHSSDGTTLGYGYCYAGCFADGDCIAGERCQKETGTCQRSVIAYSKKLGDACTSADASKNACNCLYTTPTNKGYCSAFCELGGPACPTGFTCDAFLPSVDPFTGGPAFTVGPKGLAGYCMKDCTSDADCTALNGYCQQNGGTGRKTCQPGTHP